MNIMGSQMNGKKFESDISPAMMEELEPRLLLSGDIHGPDLNALLEIQARGTDIISEGPEPIVCLAVNDSFYSEFQSPYALGEGAEPLVPLVDTFQLHSNPGASKTIYLDFDGHITTGTEWNTYTGLPTIVTPAYNFEGNSSFSDAELTRIQRI